MFLCAVSTDAIVCSSADTSSGLFKCASIPASMDSRLSLSKALAEMAIMGKFAFFLRRACE